MHELADPDIRGTDLVYTQEPLLQKTTVQMLCPILKTDTSHLRIIRVAIVTQSLKNITYRDLKETE